MVIILFAGWSADWVFYLHRLWDGEDEYRPNMRMYTLPFFASAIIVPNEVMLGPCRDVHCHAPYSIGYLRRGLPKGSRVGHERGENECDGSEMRSVVMGDIIRHTRNSYHRSFEFMNTKNARRDTPGTGVSHLA